ncbi:polyvinylalcohol dehydrogenase [Bacteroidia bacterium]|nr:polyvinylalcohol dehydrogenase [Bacteroidia bacterium]GHU54161.1 polyvinylalcohol dehydrogenase [Bacteroidia bacterium]GHU76646.1 polyvinylalcohol dehydrogenase [Bacteroidia bacterium]
MISLQTTTNMKQTILLGLLFAFAFTLQAQDILQWRNNRSGIYTETGLLKAWPADGPQLLWNYDGLGEGHSSVAISSGKIYLTGMTSGKGYLYVFDTNGKLLNKKEYGAEWDESYNGTRGTVTANDGNLYLVSGRGEIVCFKESDLSIVWKKNFLKEYNSENLKWGICESPLIVGEKLIITPGGKTHNIVALNKKTGALIWVSEGAGTGDLSAYCSPIYLGDQQVPQIVTMTAKHVVGIDVATGKKLWAFEQENRTSVHANTPVYGDNMLLCTSGYGKGSAMLRLTNGGRSVEQVWFSSQLDSRIGAMVKLGDYAYGSGDNNRFWFCVDWKTGEIKYKDNAMGIGCVIADDGMLYCYSDRGDFALAKATPEKFDIVSRFKITLGTDQHWAHPVIYKGILYVRHGNTLMAYKIS